MNWNKRTLFDDHGFSVTIVTDATPEAVFQRYKSEVDAKLPALKFCCEQRHAQFTAKDRAPLTKQPQWSKAMERILNECANRAGLRDT